MNLTTKELAHLILAYNEMTHERATQLIEDLMDARNQVVHNNRDHIFSTLKIPLIKLIREWYMLESQFTVENRNSLHSAKQYVEEWIASTKLLFPE